MADNPTLESIGRACGVSHITVSRALRGVASVKPGTAKRIRDYVAEIGYKPNPIARSLARSRNGEFHLVSTRSIVIPYNEESVHEMPLFWEYVEGAVQAASLKKSSIEVMGFKGGDAEFDFIRALVEEDRIAGVLDFGLMPRTADYLLSKKVPLVSRLHGVHAINNRRHAAVYPDHIQGYLLAWHYLFDLGHRRFGFIVQTRDEPHLQQCVAASHLIAEPPRIERVIRTERFPVAEAIRDALVSQLGKWKKNAWPSVFFCSNDAVAHQAVVGLSEMGLSVPGDVSIFGFDDSPASRFCNPPISTLSNPRKEIGAAMLHLLKDIIAGRPNSRNRMEILPMKLIRRKSVQKIISPGTANDPKTTTKP